VATVEDIKLMRLTALQRFEQDDQLGTVIIPYWSEDTSRLIKRMVFTREELCQQQLKK
jgi:hypothetical protein